MDRLRACPLVVLIDDDLDDLYLTERAITKAEIDVEIRPFDRAEEAQIFLQKLVSCGFKLPANSVIFCDIKMPRMSGFDLIEWVRTQPALNPFRIFFLSGSNETTDREHARKLHAAGYCVKYPTPDIFRRIIENQGPVAVCDL